MDRPALTVSEHLELDVPGLGEIFFEIDSIVAEGGLGFEPGGGDGVGQRFGAPGHLHAAPAAAGRGLDDHRIADVAGHLQRLGFLGDCAFRAGHAGNAEALGGALGLDLVAHEPDMLRPSGR